MNHHCECGVESPLNYPVWDVEVWGQSIFSVFMTNEASVLFHTLMLNIYAK